MKKTLFALIAGATLLLAGAAHAGVTNFDELPTDPDGEFAILDDISPYAGLSWSGWFSGDNTIGGYGNAAHSGNNYALNGYGSDADISSATGFNFAGAWFAVPEGAPDKASWINISAFDAANQLIGTTGNVAVGTSYLWVGAAFGNVSRLNIARDSGWYVMDDFTTVAAATVPEPGTGLMLGLGLGLMALVAGRRKSAR